MKRLGLLLALMAIVKFMGCAQSVVAIERVTIENKSSGKIFSRDSLTIPIEKTIDIGGVHLSPDTLHFYGLDAQVDLPIRNVKWIGYFEGSKIYDVPIESNLSIPTDSIDECVPIFSFWKFGDMNSGISFDDDTSIKHCFVDSLCREEWGEKNIGGKLLYSRKKTYLKHGFTILYINCTKERLPVCDYIFDNIRLECIKKE